MASGKVRHIGVLDTAAPDPDRLALWGLFQRSLSALGNTDTSFEVRWAHGRTEWLAALTDELVKLGVDVLCFGGTKNGLPVGEAVIFFNRDLAKEFDYRCKQAGQLASKMRYLSAPWVGMLKQNAWRKHAQHANRMARLLEQKIASGYNRLGMMSAEGGVQPKEYLAKYIAERVRKVSGTWMGATLGCAECHDHKFDPIPQEDYYALAGIFRSTETCYGTVTFINAQRSSPLLSFRPLPTRKQKPRRRNRSRWRSRRRLLSSRKCPSPRKASCCCLP